MKSNLPVKNGPIRLAYLVTHPIQYHATMLRLIAQDPDVSLKVFFRSEVSARAFYAAGFNTEIEWDVALQDGYKYEALPAFGRTDRFSFWRPLNFGLARRLRAENFDVLWIHGYMHWFHLWAMVAAKSMGIKVLLRDEVNRFSAIRGTVKKIAKKPFFALLKKFSDAFLAIGSLNKQYYVGYGVQEQDIFLVPYAVDNEFFQSRCRQASTSRDELRTTLGLEAGRPIILFAGKLMERKRPHDLLEAYTRLSPDGVTEPKPYLLFVGTGEMLDTLRRRGAELKWDSIRFVGFRGQKELTRYYDLCDVFVLPSEIEPWGLAVNEAMNAACAIVVSDKVGCGPDLVKPGHNGFTFPAGDVSALAEKLRAVIGDPQRIRTMGLNSLKIVDQWSFAEDLEGLKRALRALVPARVGFPAAGGAARGTAEDGQKRAQAS
jgi:glycosyltransferase involved in cell wall biosynthesis